MILKQNQFNNTYSKPDTYSYHEIMELRRKVEQLEKENNEKQNTINDLQKNRNQTYPFQSTNQYSVLFIVYV